MSLYYSLNNSLSLDINLSHYILLPCFVSNICERYDPFTCTLHLQLLANRQPSSTVFTLIYFFTSGLCSGIVIPEFILLKTMALSGLRSQSKEKFLKEQEFDSTNVNSFDVVSIHKSPSLHLYQREVAKRDLSSWCKQAPSQHGEFRLIRIDRKRGGTPSSQRRLLIDRETFLACFASFGLDHWFLYLVRNSSYGLHYFRKEPTATMKAPMEVFYVNTIAFALLWSYNHLDASTSAILIPRDITDLCNDFWKASVTYRNFVGHLERHKELTGDPCLLLSLSCFETLQWMDSYLEVDLHTIREVEFGSGHSTWRGARSDVPGTEELSGMSKSMGRVLCGLFDLTRHIPVVQVMLDHIRDHTLTTVSSLPGPSLTTPSTPAVETLEETIPTLQRWLDRTNDMLLYVQNRAKNQFPIVSSSLLVLSMSLNLPRLLIFVQKRTRRRAIESLKLLKKTALQ
jgi:hypothetical protein